MLGYANGLRGEKRPQGDGWRTVTVGNAAFNNDYQRIWCDDCRHQLIIHAVDLIELHGVPPETPFWTPAQRWGYGK